MSNPERLLEIHNLSIHYDADGGLVRAVDGLDLRIDKGETLGFVGETGAGKTTTALGIMRLVPDPPGRIVSGEILLEGTNLLELSEARMREVRGGRIAMIFQDPMTSLNPLVPVREQIAEMIGLHQPLGSAQALEQAERMLEKVGIRRERAGEYPHQFSGGMRQRVVIAIALACRPSLIIADEPTTALDVTIQAQVLELMKELKRELHTATLLITHDLGVVAETCDRVAIMYAGKVVECAPIAALYGKPRHPYTQGLFNALPDLDDERSELQVIKGLPPDPTCLPGGCAFHPRCDRATGPCRNECPAMRDFGDGHAVACFNPQEYR
jgi:peptide/nickel transport system ATP-binding protein